MKAIYIPVTKNNFNFIKKIHPSDLRLSINDELGLIFLSICKLHVHCLRSITEKISRDKYPKDLKILVHDNAYDSVRNISMKGIRATNMKIDKMLKKQAYCYIREERAKSSKIKIVDAIVRFCDIYGLTMTEKELSTLDRYDRRLREKNGELLYKQKRTKKCQFQNEVPTATT